MHIATNIDTDLIVQSFAYVAGQLAGSPSCQYEQILGEAEKHCSALRLVQRDVTEMTGQGLRRQAISKSECERLREVAAQAIAQAQQAITRIAAQYAPQKMAA